MLCDAARRPGQRGAGRAVSGWEPYIDFAPITPETEYRCRCSGMASYFVAESPSTVIDQLPDDSTFNSTFDVLLADSWTDLFLDEPERTRRERDQPGRGRRGVRQTTRSRSRSCARRSGRRPAGRSSRRTSPSRTERRSRTGCSVGRTWSSISPAAATPGGPLYRGWTTTRSPRRVRRRATTPDSPYTSSADEVSDITQFSRALFQAAPGLFTEPYFPTRSLLDTFAVSAGDRSGTLADLRYTDGIDAAPVRLRRRRRGPRVDHRRAHPPTGPQPQVHVVAAGYNHLDVLTAARVPEQRAARDEQRRTLARAGAAEVLGPPAAVSRLTDDRRRPSRTRAHRPGMRRRSRPAAAASADRRRRRSA